MNDIMTYEGSHAPEIAELCGQIEKLNKGVSISVVLIGSAARGAETWRSDIDLLVLSEQPLMLPRDRGRFHLHVSDEARILKRLEDGDDFPAWCVRYGIPVLDSGIWTKLVESDEARIWPDWAKKVPHATRRLLIASFLLRSGDEEAAGEELLYALGHVARMILLRSNVFPLSRGELVAQVKDVGFLHLSTGLEALLSEHPDTISLRQYITYCKKLLCSIDRDAYGLLSVANSKVVSVKKRSRSA